jgi:shikimate kinase
MISLIGYRGTGKTSVAVVLARRLGWNWIDADEEIQRRSGQSIAEIFATVGEQGFRDLETLAILESTSSPDRLVLSCGGGAVLRPENRQALKAAGKVVWLQATPQTILKRLAADPRTAAQRPPLTSQGGLEEVRQLLAIREPLYAETADLAVDTEGKTLAAVAAEIVDGLGLLKV